MGDDSAKQYRVDSWQEVTFNLSQFVPNNRLTLLGFGDFIFLLFWQEI
jgi:hypothetical protein